MNVAADHYPYDLEHPTPKQITVFGSRRLEATLADLATAGTTEMLTNTVVALCTQYGNDTIDTAVGMRALSLPAKRFRAPVEDLLIGHNRQLAEDRHVYRADKALAAVFPHDRGSAWLRPQGRAAGLYLFGEHLFVHGHTGRAFVERYILSDSVLGRANAASAVMPASETETAATLDRVYAYMAGDDTVRLQQAAKALQPRPWWRRSR